MASVEQSIDVDVPLANAQESWRHFTEWILVGNYRLVCDAWSCDRMADGETVGFADLGGGRSRVTVRFEYDAGSSPDPDARQRLVATRLSQDLSRFRDYVAAEPGRGARERGGRTGADYGDDRAGRLRVTPDSIIEHDHDDLFGSPHYQS